MIWRVEFSIEKDPAAPVRIALDYAALLTPRVILVQWWPLDVPYLPSNSSPESTPFFVSCTLNCKAFVCRSLLSYDLSTEAYSTGSCFWNQLKSFEGIRSSSAIS